MSADNGHVERVARQTWRMFVCVEVVCLLITASALVDNLFSLGWGYDWDTVAIGSGISIFSGILWFACRAIFRAFGGR